jgi:hypothetical protein
MPLAKPFAGTTNEVYTLVFHPGNLDSVLEEHHHKYSPHMLPPPLAKAAAKICAALLHHHQIHLTFSISLNTLEIKT